MSEINATTSNTVKNVGSGSLLSNLSREILKNTQYPLLDEQLSIIPDTIHYLSPATTTARTEYEGDFDYGRFMPHLMGMDIYEPPDLSLFTESTIECDEGSLQRTLAIIKPDAMIYKDVVLRAVKETGFHIINERVVHLTPEQVAEIYAQYYGCPSFPNRVVSVSIGPLLVLSLAARNAVQKWKTVVGPRFAIKQEWFVPLSMRQQFGLHMDMPDMLHASENLQQALKENRYFFPNSVLEPIITDEEKVKDYCDLYIKPTLLRALTELVKTKPIDPILFLAEWLLINNPFQPQMPYNVITTPT